VKDDGKNFLLFAVLAALILFGWQMIGAKFFPVANPPATKIVDGKSKPVDTSGGPAGPSANQPGQVRDREKVIAESPRVRIETPRLAGSINLKGARIDDLILSKYKETIAKDSKSIRLFSPSGAQHAYFASFGWSGDGVTTPGADTVFTASAPVLTPASPVTLAWTNPQGMRFSIRIAIDERYMFAVRQTVTNPGAKPVTIRPYALISRTGISPDPGPTMSARSACSITARPMTSRSAICRARKPPSSARSSATSASPAITISIRRAAGSASATNTGSPR
jgi:YidC/Oxa1 family membrane protein insertase